MNGKEMTDGKILAAFEACTLPAENWDHRAHLRIAYVYASTLPLKQAVDKMRAGIQTYNTAIDTPEAIDRGYHETITIAFMRLVFHSIGTHIYESSDHFYRNHPELLEKKILLQFYSRERLMSREAKRGFLAPDIQPLPFP